MKPARTSHTGIARRWSAAGRPPKELRRCPSLTMDFFNRRKLRRGPSLGFVARDAHPDRMRVFHRDVGNRCTWRESMASRRAASSRARGSEYQRTHSARRHRMYVVIGATGHTGNIVAENCWRSVKKFAWWVETRGGSSDSSREARKLSSATRRMRPQWREHFRARRQLTSCCRQISHRRTYSVISSA